MATDSIFGDCYVKLDKPFVIRSLRDEYRETPDGQKRCRICNQLLPLAEYRKISNQGKAWLYYACYSCSRQLQKDAYQRRKLRKSTSAINPSETLNNDTYHPEDKTRGGNPVTE